MFRQMNGCCCWGIKFKPEASASPIPDPQPKHIGIHFNIQQMDSSIKAHKLQAMKNYKRAQLLYNLIVYALTAFLSCLFYLYLFWIPSSSMNHFFSVLVPNVYSLFILSPSKLLFIVGNLIVLFLVGESKLGYSGSKYSSSSPADELYDEYVRRSQGLREVRSFSFRSSQTAAGQDDNRIRVVVRKDNHHRIHAAATSTSTSGAADTDKMMKVEEIEDIIGGGNSIDIIDEADEVVISNKVQVEEKLGSIREEKQEQEVVPHVHDKDGGGHDQLKTRVEDFIARVTRQMKLEEST